MNRLIVVFSVLLLTTAGGLAAESLSFEYRPISKADLDRVQKDWRNRDLRARNIKVVHEEDRDGFELLVVQHDISSRAHFGAIFVPDVDDLSNVPVVVLPDHLEQWNPTIDIEQNIEKYQSYEPLTGFIKILPGFRGRFVDYKDRGWFSRGDFCDAFDGPADDSIAMLNVAEELFPEVNFEEVLVWGGSRGGTTALLMAVRDARVNTVIALGAPVDFYRESWQVPGSDQYRCQFFDEKSDEQSRQRILASSPLFFEPHENLEAVSLHHDAGDEVVLVWNVHEVADHLESHSVDVTKYIYPTEGHGAMVAEESFWENMKTDISEFLRRTKK